VVVAVAGRGGIMVGMAKAPKGKRDKHRDTAPVIYLRLDANTYRGLLAYIDRQETPPDKTTVGLVALRQFLAKHDCYPPKD
jgi:hypothetical protein